MVGGYIPKVPTPVTIYVDPGCPWCFQTVRWARMVEAAGVIDISWGFLPLEVHNSDSRVLDLQVHTRTVPAMRVALLVREELGQAAAGRFYLEIAGRQHHRDEQLKLPDTIRGALVDAGIDEGYAARALEDDGTAVRLMEGYRKIADRAIGVATFEFDREGGPTMFGPVIAQLPDEAGALELWEHFEWIVRNGNIYEIKGMRNELPDLEGLRLAQNRRDARLAATAAK
jgi:hypothetical protein